MKAFPCKYFLIISLNFSTPFSLAKPPSKRDTCWLSPCVLHLKEVKSLMFWGPVSNYIPIPDIKMYHFH